MLDSEAINRGPIPARAGQPLKPQPCAQGSGAYPRSRGATCASIAPRHALEGLSPLARGNHSCSALDASAVGPIPARAGQPPHCASHAHGHRAYPRSRGATASARRARASQTGLSPLARGNRARIKRNPPGQGPIPARAGQPSVTAEDLRALGAYPRSRGATRNLPARGSKPEGLSPLARGNLGAAGHGHQVGGPIPARAGQPPKTWG